MTLRTGMISGIALLAIVAAVFSRTDHDFGQRAHAESPQSKTMAAPVEPSMHEFMEYVFQPPYKRLHAVMATEPADNAAWKAIKSDALILAEAGNLLLIRHPDENDQAWREHSAEVRELGGAFYQAARKKDYSAAKEQYSAMLQKCNSCHRIFADGKYQLTP
ncbi:hypothetical protein GC176_02085 [bacterium]|nr:hypothetical protein [bacterium]